MCSRGAHIAAVEFGCQRIFACVRHTSTCSEARPVSREHMPHRSFHAPKEYGRRASMPFPVRAAHKVPNDHCIVLGVLLGECAVRCTLGQAVFLSIDGFWDTVLSMMRRVPEAKSRLQIRSRNVDSSTVPPCEKVLYTLLEAISSTTQFRAEGPAFHPTQRNESLREHISCGRPRWCRMQLYGCLRRGEDSFFEWNRLLDPTSSVRFRHELVSESSNYNVEYPYSPTQQRDLFCP